MNVLGIETSCDETSASVVCDGVRILSNIVLSQASQHNPYGGVVPELASRSHLSNLPGIIEKAVAESGVEWKKLDAVAVTYGPGLASSLLVGISAAKALALSLRRDLICVNHLEAHMYSPFLGKDTISFFDACPFLALIVSGGHTCLLRVEALSRYHLLGATQDDAAGEAFDKGAKMLGLGYPGGPAIDALSLSGNPKALSFPRGRLSDKKRRGNLRKELCFSFSGVKTSLLYYAKSLSPDELRIKLPDIAASYQEAIIDALIDRTKLALRCENLRNLAVAGGVSLNSRLRKRLKELAGSLDKRLFLADSEHCVDNAAMTAGLAGVGGGIKGQNAWLLDASPNLEIGT